MEAEKTEEISNSESQETLRPHIRRDYQLGNTTIKDAYIAVESVSFSMAGQHGNYSIVATVYADKDSMMSLSKPLDRILIHESDIEKVKELAGSGEPEETKDVFEKAKEIVLKKLIEGDKEETPGKKE